MILMGIKQKSPLAAGVLFILLFSFLLLFSSFLNPPERGDSEFWHSVYLEDNSELEQAVQFLESKGMGQVSSSLLPVVYSEFTHLDEVPLRDMSRRLLTEDPRFDPFLKELIRFYSSDKGERILYTSTLPGRRLNRMIRNSDISFMTEEESGPYFTRYILIFLLVIAFPFLFKKQFYLPLGVLLLWGPYLLRGDFSEASVITVVVLLQSLLIFRSYGKENRLAALAALAVIGGVHCYSRGGYSFALELVFISVFSWVSGGILNRDEPLSISHRREYFASLSLFFLPGKSRSKSIPLRYRLKMKKEHTLFEPAFFSGGRKKKTYTSFPGKKHYFFYAVLILFSLPLFVIPAEKANTVPEMPDQEDMIHHLYYQDNILIMSGWNDYPVLMPEHYEWSREDGSVNVVSGGEILSAESFLSEKGRLYTRGYGGSFLFSYDEKDLSDVYLERDKYLDNYYILAIIGLFVLYGNLFSLHRNKNNEKISFTTRRGRKVA